MEPKELKLKLPENSQAAQKKPRADDLPSLAPLGVAKDTDLSSDDKSVSTIEAVSSDPTSSVATKGAASTKNSGSPASQKTQGAVSPSILYCCPANILDITSGAALSQRTLMIALAQKGFRAVALQATVFDSQHGGDHLIKAFETQKDKKILLAQTDGLKHIILRTKAPRRHDMTCAEQEIFLNLFRTELAKRRPDMIFMWGGMLLEMEMMRVAREARIPVVFYLVNGGYKSKDTFKYVNVVVSDTQATARLYKERLGLNCQVVGKFIDPKLVKPTVPRRPDYITFINPSFEKGVSVFMPLAKLAAKEMPEVKFLVVQGRGRWGAALQILKFKPEDFPNVKVIGHQANMRPVYASTRALILPSLWHESGARVIAEAQINSIPIIASNTGGSAELIGRGGKVFDIPELAREKRGEVHVSESDLRPWLEEIKRIWSDETYYNDMCKKVELEARQHDLNRNVDRFIKAVAPVVLASKGLGPDGKPIKRSAPATPVATPAKPIPHQSQKANKATSKKKKK